jgi:glycosyltransferase involved in cell wall biosynthesis
MKTILHLSESVGVGGAETVFIQLATLGSNDRLRNLAALPGPGWAADALNAAGVRPLHVSISRSGSPVDLGLYRSIVRLIRDYDVDLVQSHSLGISVYSCLAGLRTRTPVVCTLHGVVDLGRADRNRRIKLGILRRGAAKIVLVSNHLQEKLLAESRIPEDRTAVVYNGVDCDRHSMAQDRTFRAELEIDDDSFLFGAVGNVRAPKAYDNLLRAAAIAVTSNPKMRFAVVGEGSGKLLDELLRLRAELGLEDIVQFAGFRQDVSVPLRNFDGFVLSSRSEGFPIAPIQAMAAGLPAVATRCGGPEEQITDGVDGLLVPPENPQALASAMLRVASDASLRAQLGQAARATARARFSLTKMLSSYEEMYQALIGQRDQAWARNDAAVERA